MYSFENLLKIKWNYQQSVNIFDTLRVTTNFTVNIWAIQSTTM